MKKEWRFLRMRWWIVHFIGFVIVYSAGRIISVMLGG